LAPNCTMNLKKAPSHYQIVLNLKSALFDQLLLINITTS